MLGSGTLCGQFAAGLKHLCPGRGPQVTTCCFDKMGTLTRFCCLAYNIPHLHVAAQVTTCCFDKTGTLTSDHMRLEGVAGAAGGH